MEKSEMSGLVEVSAEQKPTYIVTATATASATVAVALVEVSTEQKQT